MLRDFLHKSVSVCLCGKAFGLWWLQDHISSPNHQSEVSKMTRMSLAEHASVSCFLFMYTWKQIRAAVSHHTIQAQYPIWAAICRGVTHDRSSQSTVKRAKVAYLPLIGNCEIRGRKFSEIITEINCRVVHKLDYTFAQLQPHVFSLKEAQTDWKFQERKFAPKKKKKKKGAAWDVLSPIGFAFNTDKEAAACYQIIECI